MTSVLNIYLIISQDVVKTLQPIVFDGAFLKWQILNIETCETESLTNEQSDRFAVRREGALMAKTNAIPMSKSTN
jgi:hypothetical protein